MSTRKSEIKKKLLQKIKEEKNLSFPEIQCFFEYENYDYKGEHNLYTFNDNGETNYSQLVWDVLMEVGRAMLKKN